MPDPAPSRGRFSAYQLGDIRIVTVSDGVRRFPLPDGFITNASRPEINAALAAAGLPPDEITTPFNPVVIEHAGRRALLDTGNGAAAGQAREATNGLLRDSLEAAGIAPASIDTIVISHFHGDHVLGLLDPDGAPAFPAAQVRVPAPEWDFWMDDAQRSAAAPGRMAQLFDMNRRVFAALAGNVHPYAWNTQPFPGLTAIGTPGHSVGHTSFMLESAGERLFIQSDVTNNPALFVTHPGWHAAFDQDPQRAEATRRTILGRAAAERWVVQGFHFPFPSRGHIETDGPGFRFVPLP